MNAQSATEPVEYRQVTIHIRNGFLVMMQATTLSAVITVVLNTCSALLKAMWPRTRMAWAVRMIIWGKMLDAALLHTPANTAATVIKSIQEIKMTPKQYDNFIPMPIADFERLVAGQDEVQSETIQLKLRAGKYVMLALNANPQMVMHTDGRFKIPTAEAVKEAEADMNRRNERLSSRRK